MRSYTSSRSHSSACVALIMNLRELESSDRIQWVIAMSRAKQFQEQCMTFSTHFARALMPIAVIAMATPIAAAESADMAKVRAHLSNVQSMTADFSQTDARGRSAAGTLQLKRPGRVRFQY